MFIVAVDAKSLRLRSLCHLIWSGKGPLPDLCSHMVESTGQKANSFQSFYKCTNPISMTVVFT